MPSINLRLTDQQHAELAEWARVGHRSIQKEIIWRLFTIEGHQAAKHAPAIPVDADWPTPAEEHFKPDFGSKIKPK
jgi:hypothetical protein